MEITAKDVMKLRQMTSAGMMDCKKAPIDTIFCLNVSMSIFLSFYIDNEQPALL